MGIFDIFLEANWDELYAFFSKGNPPLLVVLLAINTAVFIFFVVRRMRGKSSMRPETASTVQTMLLAANMFAIFYEEIYRAITRLM
jgi:hypothetical protein